VSEGLLRGYIRELRNVLGDDAEHPQFIETVPRRGYRFVAATTVAPLSRFPFPVSRAPLPTVESTTVGSASFPRETWNLKPETMLVGREAELTHLHQWLAKAASGTRQVVFVSGEAGIGKTTLVDVFLQSLESRVQGPESQNTDPRPPTPDPWFARGQCIEHYGAGEAYLPVLEALGQLCRQPRGEQIVTLLSRYAPTWLVQMPALLSDSEFDALQRKVQGATRERMLREMAEALDVLTAERPLILWLEDLHWSDPSTLELLALLARRQEQA